MPWVIRLFIIGHVLYSFFLFGQVYAQGERLDTQIAVLSKQIPAAKAQDAAAKAQDEAAFKNWSGAADPVWGALILSRELNSLQSQVSSEISALQSQAERLPMSYVVVGGQAMLTILLVWLLFNEGGFVRFRRTVIISMAIVKGPLFSLFATVLPFYLAMERVPYSAKGMHGAYPAMWTLFWCAVLAVYLGWSKKAKAYYGF